VISASVVGCGSLNVTIATSMSVSPWDRLRFVDVFLLCHYW
jgi:hypothetical protein